MPDRPQTAPVPNPVDGIEPRYLMHLVLAAAPQT